MAGWLDGWMAGWLDGWMAGWYEEIMLNSRKTSDVLFIRQCYALSNYMEQSKECYVVAASAAREGIIRQNSPGPPADGRSNCLLE